MHRIVENLVLKSDGLAGLGRVDEILDAAIGAAGDGEVDGELEVGVAASGHDVAGVAALLPSVVGDVENAVFDLPASNCDIGTLGTEPAFGAFAVEQEVPALGGLFLCECVGSGLGEGGDGRGKDQRGQDEMGAHRDISFGDRAMNSNGGV